MCFIFSLLPKPCKTDLFPYWGNCTSQKKKPLQRNIKARYELKISIKINDFYTVSFKYEGVTSKIKPEKGLTV